MAFKEIDGYDDAGRLKLLRADTLAKLAEVENRAAWSFHPNQDRELPLDSDGTRMGHFVIGSVSGGRFGGLNWPAQQEGIRPRHGRWRDRDRCRKFGLGVCDRTRRRP